MRKWLTGLEVIEKLGINDFELFDFVKEGLPPYTHAREKLPPPNVSDILQSIEEAEKEKDTLEFYNSGLKPKSDIAIKNILEAVKKNPALALNYLAPSPYIRGLHENAKKRMQELNAKLKEIDDRYCWQDYELPNDRMKIRRIYDSLLNSLYRVEDVEATSHAPQIESVIQEANAPAPVRAVNFFERQNGDYWHIGFEGKETALKKLDGLLYISYLLQKPGTPIPCRDLYQALSGQTPDKIMSKGAAIDEGLNIGHRKQVASDHEAKQCYLERYRKLANDLDNVEDNPEGGTIRKEIEKEMETIFLFLKERTFTDKDTTRFQSNVRKRLDNAYAAIRKAGMKGMEKHLRDNIKTDGAFGLSYTGTLAWEIIIK